jgi:hypothetical protein
LNVQVLWHIFYIKNIKYKLKNNNEIQSPTKLMFENKIK